MTQNRSIGKSISFISRSLGRYIDSKTKHLGLSHFTVPFLTYLYEHDGVHQDELAENLQFDKSSAARAVSALEKSGYVTKTPDLNNRRRNTIKITKKALAIKPELFQILELTTKKLFEGFSADQVELYFESTDHINLNAQTMLMGKK